MSKTSGSPAHGTRIRAGRLWRTRWAVRPAGLAAGLSLLMVVSAAAQNAPALRRIAPDSVPDYRGAAVDAPDPPVTLPTEQKPQGSCERGVARPAWLRCLRATSELTDQEVNKTAALVQEKLDAKAGAAAGRKRFLARALEQAQEFWRNGRNHECQQLASSEPGLVADMYEARLLCLVRFDLQRIGNLKSRFQIDH